jgi:hypothetical protein
MSQNCGISEPQENDRLGDLHIDGGKYENIVENRGRGSEVIIGISQ